MNRRTFLKALTAAGVVAAAPKIIVSERKVWALDRTMTAGVRVDDPFDRADPGFVLGLSGGRWAAIDTRLSAIGYSVDEVRQIVPDRYSMALHPGQIADLTREMYADHFNRARKSGLFLRSGRDDVIVVGGKDYKVKGYLHDDQGLSEIRLG